MSVHLTDDQLVDRLYGIEQADTHLEACLQCQARWEQIQQRRAQSVPLAPGAEFFHRQRRQIQGRMASPQPVAWVPAAVAFAVIAGLLVTRTLPVPAPVKHAETEIIEAGWFEDTYSATQVLEPLAASPIRALFVEGPVLE